MLRFLLQNWKGVVNQIEAGVIDETQGRIIAADIIRNAKYGPEGYFGQTTRKGIM